MIATGVVTPMDENNDNQEMYTLCITTEHNKDYCYDYAYEQEIIEYIKTGTFEYNDFLISKNK